MTLEERALRALRERGLTLALAESLTGGLLGARLTRIPGSSEVVRGGIVAYTDPVKASLLGVDRRLLEEKGAVTADVARQMANGAREALGTDIGVALTGFAGPNIPEGGEIGKVFVALAHWGATEVHELRLSGDRDAIRDASVNAALEYLLSIAEKAADART